MKTRTTAQVVWLTVAGIMIAVAGGARAATWQGGDGSWTDGAADNWGQGVGVYPGDAANANSNATINSGDTVTLSSDLVNSLGNAWSPNGLVLANSTLNIQASLTSAGYSQLGNWSSFTIHHSAGTFSQNFRFDFGSAANQGTSYQSYYNLSGGVLDVNNNDFRFGYGGRTNNHLYVTVSGSGDLQAQNINMGQATLKVTGGSVAGTGTCDMNGNNADAKSVIWVDGKNSTLVSFGALEVTSDTETATLRFTLSAAGVTPITAPALTLGTNSVLEANVTGLPDSQGDGVELIDYTNPIGGDGEFGTVNVTDDGLGTLAEGTLGSLGLGQYALDYADGVGGTSVVLYYVNAAPKGTIVLLM